MLNRWGERVRKGKVYAKRNRRLGRENVVGSNGQANLRRIYEPRRLSILGHLCDTASSLSHLHLPSAASLPFRSELNRAHSVATRLSVPLSYGEVGWVVSTKGRHNSTSSRCLWRWQDGETTVR